MASLPDEDREHNTGGVTRANEDRAAGVLPAAGLTMPAGRFPKITILKARDRKMAAVDEI
jgi:hypothetical protein